MMMTIANASIPAERQSVEIGLANNQAQDLEATRVIFFAGDAIPSNEKYEMPSIKGFGGIFLPQIKTLPIENKGMLYRCKLTRLTTRMIPEWTVMLPPAERKTWDKAFTQSNAVLKDGRWQDHIVDGFTQSDPQATREGRFETKKSDHLVYKKRYPGTDVRYATRRSQPHGIGGIVEVTALLGASEDAIYEAQAFFFPDWINIRKGEEGHELPQTLRETEDHFKTRIRAIPADWPQAKRDQYRQIGGAMIQSCTEYRISGLSILQKNETIIKDAATKGVTATYPPFCEFLLEFLEQKRKDDLVSGESSAVDRLARAMENSGKFTESKPDLEVQRLELELLKERNRAKELEIEAAKVSSAIIVPVGGGTGVNHAGSELVINAGILTSSADPVISMETADPFAQGLSTFDNDVSGPVDRVCGKPTSNGECKRELKTGEESCWQHK